MMLGLLLSAGALFALNVLTPGVSFVLTLRCALAHGARIGRALALGLSAVDILFAALALFGVAALLGAHAGVLAAVGGLGGIWLGTMGLRMFDAARGRQKSDPSAIEQGLTWPQAFRRGVGAGLLNIQAVAFFGSVLVANLRLKPSFDQACAVAAVIGATSIVLRASIATVVTHRSIREGYLARKRQVELLSGVALFGFGMKVAVHALLPVTVQLLTSRVSIHLA